MPPRLPLPQTDLLPDFPSVHVGELSGRLDGLREAVARNDISLQVVAGAQMSLVWALEADDEDLALGSYGQRGTDVLVETPTGPVAGLDRLLYELRGRGFRVTLALSY